MNNEYKINEALNYHHEFVRAQNFTPVMTVLVGSQNYDLATENSDYDTFTFVLPTMEDLATINNPVSTTLAEDEYGHINVKDIRLALNLLKRTNPNSVECFASKYKIVEAKFSALCMFPPVVLRCDTANMMNAIGGIAYQMSKRNMPYGKRLAHILRMHCMVYKYMDVGSDILSMTKEEHDLAMKAKLDPDNPKWNGLCIEWAKIVDDDIKNIDVHYFDRTAVYAMEYIKTCQADFVRKAVELYE